MELNELEKYKKNPEKWGAFCAKQGMSIHANPYRNTGSDNPVDAYQLWEKGWLSEGQ